MLWSSCRSWLIRTRREAGAATCTVVSAPEVGAFGPRHRRAVGEFRVEAEILYGEVTVPVATIVARDLAGVKGRSFSKQIELDDALICSYSLINCFSAPSYSCSAALNVGIMSKCELCERSKSEYFVH